jgi:aminoglycoside phosphotransferase (APT) family kinase protein
LPRIASAAGQVEKEQGWLPALAPNLPLTVPRPLAKGVPGEGYPWSWSVYAWLDGENATTDRIDDMRETAVALGGFISALQRIDPTGGPAPGPENAFRGAALAERDAATRAAIASLDGWIDRAAVTAAWEMALRASPWSGPPVWIHGDLQSGNLLTVDGWLSAVIDFGCLGVGDPACDLMVAWNLFTAETRMHFRSALQVDDATWRRGRGWALSVGLIALPYYRTLNPAFAAIARHAVDEVVMEHRRKTSFSI